MYFNDNSSSKKWSLTQCEDRVKHGCNKITNKGLSRAGCDQH